MSEITVKYEMDPEHEKLLKENNVMLKELIKSRRTPLSDIMISSKQLRKEWGISAKTEYTYRQKGILKGRKIGNRWYYLVSDIIALLGDPHNSIDAHE